jgi:hypothetical protein
MKALTPVKNQRGIIVVDFLFSMVLILGLSGLLFVLCFTMSVASVTQYVTFAAARTFVAGNITYLDQRNAATAKYTELITSPVLKPLYNNGWFAVDNRPMVGDATEAMPEYAEAAQSVNKFWGVNTSFTAMVLAFTIPFFGSTAMDGDETGAGFKTNIGSYLGREPATEECLEFSAQRWTAIKALGPGYGTQGGTYYSQTDDGC